MHSQSMTHPTSHRATALDHLAAVQAHSDNLRDEWQKPRPDSNDIKYLTASIGRGLKMAEIHATLDIGAQIARLADRLEDYDILDFVRPLRPRVRRHADGTRCTVDGCSDVVARG